MRITAQLIDGASGGQMWTQRFDDTLEDVFDLQDKVALSVAAVIEPTVHLAEIRRAAARTTDNMGSYDLYLRASTLWRTLTRAGAREALDVVNRALVLDPEYGPALALASSCHHLLATFGWSAQPEANRDQAIELAHRALNVAGDDAEVLARVAIAVAYQERDLDAAVDLAGRSIAMNAGSAAAWAASGIILVSAGTTDRGIEHIQTSIRLDPIGPNRMNQMVFMAIARFQQGRFGDAVAFAKECLQTAVELPAAYAVHRLRSGTPGIPRHSIELKGEISGLPGSRSVPIGTPAARKIFP